MFHKSLSFLALAATAVAQTSTSYVDPTTNISFQSFYDSKTGYRFGLALPETVGSDFIGQIVSHLYLAYLPDPILTITGWTNHRMGWCFPGW